jgi:hypothetical protein
MLRFLAGIVLVQAASVTLVWVAGLHREEWSAWLPIVFALCAIALVTAFWFHTVAAGLRREELNRLREGFSRERENLRLRAEQEKTRMLRKGHKDLASATRRAESRANRKVALAVVAASAVGLVMMVANFMTVGLLILAAAGGTVGGYFAGRRWTPKNLEGGVAAPVLAVPRRRWRFPLSQQTEE